MNTPKQKWNKCKIGDISTVVSGYGFPIKYQGKKEGDIPFYKVADISTSFLAGKIYLEEAQHYLSQKEMEEIKAKTLEKGTIVFAKIGEAIRLNRRVILSRRSLVDNNVIGVLPSEKVSSLYMYYFLCTQKLGELSRSTTVPSLRKGDIEDIEIPLPATRREQDLVVEKLNNVFKKTKNCKERLDKIPFLLKRFRQSVLTAACSGRLTESWREKKGIIDYTETWQTHKISDIFDINPGHKGISIRDDMDVTFLPMEKVQEEVGIIDTSIVRKYSEVKNGYTKFIEGDVVFAKITPCMENGKIALVSGLKNKIGCGTTEFHVFREKQKGLAKYLFYFLLRDDIRELARQSFQGTSGHLRVPKDFFESLDFPLPPTEEIAIIIDRIEKLFKISNNIENQYNKAKIYFNKINQSVLSKAFKGELH